MLRLALLAWVVLAIGCNSAEPVVFSESLGIKIQLGGRRYSPSPWWPWPGGDFGQALLDSATRCESGRLLPFRSGVGELETEEVERVVRQILGPRGWLVRRWVGGSRKQLLISMGVDTRGYGAAADYPASQFPANYSCPVGITEKGRKPVYGVEVEPKTFVLRVVGINGEPYSAGSHGGIFDEPIVRAAGKSPR